jgi:hypothetical protein
MGLGIYLTFHSLKDILERTKLATSEQASSGVVGSRSDLDRLLACLRLNDGVTHLKLSDKPPSTFMIPGGRKSKYCKTHRKWESLLIHEFSVEKLRDTTL